MEEILAKFHTVLVKLFFFLFLCIINEAVFYPGSIRQDCIQDRLCTAAANKHLKQLLINLNPLIKC